MFEETVSLLNTESVASNISYKSFKTKNFPTQNFYCDHRNFERVNLAYIVYMSFISVTRV
jgi:hypothetical protein